MNTQRETGHAPPSVCVCVCVQAIISACAVVCVCRCICSDVCLCMFVWIGARCLIKQMHPQNPHTHTHTHTHTRERHGNNCIWQPLSLSVMRQVQGQQSQHVKCDTWSVKTLERPSEFSRSLACSVFGWHMHTELKRGPILHVFWFLMFLATGYDEKSWNMYWSEKVLLNF